MDQKGSRFAEDLQALEEQGLLLPGAIVVADNVLKPGAPLFLWRLVKTSVYCTHIVQLNEFATTLKDWMSVSVLKFFPGDGVPSQVLSAPTESRLQLDVVPEPPGELGLLLLCRGLLVVGVLEQERPLLQRARRRG